MISYQIHYLYFLLNNFKFYFKYIAIIHSEFEISKCRFSLAVCVFACGKDFGSATNFGNLRWAPVPMHGLAGWPENLDDDISTLNNLYDFSSMNR